MINKKILSALAISSLVATSFAFAQAGVEANAQVNVQAGAEGRGPGLFQRMMGERREIRQEYRDDRKEARADFRDDMRERREWNKANATGTATGTKPTPWKNMREDMKDARADFRNGMKEMRDEMMHKMPMLNATATAAIAARLGISIDALNSQLASGTKLKEIIKDKITPEEMRNILPPRIATFTKQLEDRGFFNRIKSNLFGGKREVLEQRINEFGEVTISSTTISVSATPFWKRIFGF